MTYDCTAAQGDQGSFTTGRTADLVLVAERRRHAPPKRRVGNAVAEHGPSQSDTFVSSSERSEMLTQLSWPVDMRSLMCGDPGDEGGIRGGGGTAQ